VHEIFTRYRGIICAVNAHIEVTISHSVSECRSDKCRGVGNFATISTKLVAMAMSFEESEKTELNRENSRKYLPFDEKSSKLVQ